MINLTQYEGILIPIFKRYGINTRLRIAHFLTQLDHESNGLKRLEENLNYSVEGLIATFNRNRISLEDCHKYGRKTGRPANQKMIANIIYGGAFGLRELGNITFGDGYKYRGRGPIQATGLKNYKSFSKALNKDFVSNPDLLLNLEIGLEFAGWFWNVKGINMASDKDNIIMVRKLVNGGKIGIEETAKLLPKYKKIISEDFLKKVV